SLGAARSSAAGSVPAASSAAGTSDAEGSPPEQVLPAAPPAPRAADQVLALVNQERARTGCDVLTADDGLATTAQAHSAAMRDRGSLGLDDLDGVRAAAVAGGNADPADVVAGWLADPTDRAALLDCDLHTMGVGTADGDGGPWWTAVLA
ncbi:MAG: CAP domain-containing protein, partial [Blastococcus sp.]